MKKKVFNMGKIRDQIRFFQSDIKMWEIGTVKDILYAFFNLSIWATLVYRLSRSLFLINMPILKYIFRFISMVLNLFSEIVFGVRIPASVEIGPGLYIAHVGNIVVHHNVRVGKNFRISHGVTVGQKGEGHDDAVPIIGDEVYLGAGAKVLGGIKIGDNVWVGANAVVLKDIPDNATAVGIPAVVKRIRNK